jgi:hypothetical protein
MLIVSVLIAAIASPLSAAANTANPLELAESGLLECLRPDLKNKTCRAIAAFRKTGPGTYDDTAIVALSRQRPITVETRSPVVIRGDAVCGAVRIEEIKAGIVRDGATILPSAEAQYILDQIVQVMAPLDGQETCTRYEPSGTGITAKISVAGRYRRELDQEVKWIRPSDGYIVTP